MIVAIDGPAAAGKSTTARAVALALGFRHVDSGALYRAVTAARARLPGEVFSWTEAEVLDAARRVTVVPVVAGFEPWLDGASAPEELRSDRVTAAVPAVARMPAVRAWVNARLRDAARDHDVVVDGRDIGTTVFPQADLKVYLVADSWNRARRRLVQRGFPRPSDTDIAAEMLALLGRDQRDAEQSVQAPDAVLIDTSDISQEQQVAQIVALARAVGKA
jgi:cytidylate kinase